MACIGYSANQYVVIDMNSVINSREILLFFDFKEISTETSKEETEISIFISIQLLLFCFSKSRTIYKKSVLLENKT